MPRPDLVDAIRRVEAVPPPPGTPPLPEVPVPRTNRWGGWWIRRGAAALGIVLGLLFASVASSPVFAVVGAVLGLAIGGVVLLVWIWVQRTNARLASIDLRAGEPSAIVFTGRTVSMPKGGRAAFLDVVLRGAHGSGFLLANTSDHAVALRDGGATWAWVAGDRYPGGALLIVLPDGRLLRCRRVVGA